MFKRRRQTSQIDSWAEQVKDVKATIAAIDKELNEIRETLTRFAVNTANPDTENMARWLTAAADLWIETEGRTRGRKKRRR